MLSIGAKQKEATAVECERVAGEMSARFAGQPRLYFRLCVDQGMESIEAIDWEKRLDGIQCARSYLRLSDNDVKMSKITRAVSVKQKGVPMAHLKATVLQASNTDSAMIKPCPPPSPLFVGRDAQLDRIHRCLGGDVRGQRVCVLHGLGGVGKTQLALKNTIDADFRRIALAKKAGDSTNDALTWIARLQEPWLIVYNNADDTSMNLRSYFPACSYGSILVTPRNRGVANLASGADGRCHVAKMSQDEAVELLAKAAALTGDVDPSAVALIEMLGCFPLAIVQAGAYIQTNMCSIQDYLEIYRISRGQILEDYANEIQKADDYELTVYATWQVSYQQLSPLAKQLYGYLAFMHHDHIVEDIFRVAVPGLKRKHGLPPTKEETTIEQAATEFLMKFTSLADGAWDRATFLRTVKDLTSYSLLSCDEVNRSYSIHPLVQQWTRTVVDDPGSAYSCVAFLLASSITWEDGMEDYAHRRVLLNHVDCLPDSEKLRPRLAWLFRWVYRQSGRTRDMEEVVKAECEVNLRVLGQDSSYTLLAMAFLAEAYWVQGRLGEAEVLQRQVVDIRKRVSGNEDTETLKAMGNLALTYSEQGRWEEAEVLQREVVELRKRVSGNEHPDTLVQMGNLAQTYSSQGRWADAEVLQREVVELRKRVWGSEHPSTLISMGNLASTYSEQGRQGEAEVLQQEVVKVGKRVWGSEHPHTLIAMGNLAVMCSSQGRRKEVEVLLVEVVEVGKRVWGSQHPYSAIYARHLDGVRSHPAQSDIPMSSSSGGADNPAPSLENLHSDTVLEAATLDNVGLKLKGIDRWQLLSWSVLIALVCYFFSTLPFKWLLQVLYRRPS
ncbi:hypothetical protein FRC09_012712 [Ceratobasidium sp. 395]|nr:hypothetical protein FRC09_012712 [Ceratobasidium sp. 395]